MPYATSSNFTRRRLYDTNVCLLRPAVARAVAAANREIMSTGHKLKMWDCYRPRHISLLMWRIGEEHNRACRAQGRACLKSGCDPSRSNCLWEPLNIFVSRRSKHNQGAAVDATLVDIFGREVAMGTLYDHFGPKARTRNATGRAAKNRALLKAVMRKYGFRNYYREWWHYDHDTAPRYAPLDILISEAAHSAH